MSTDAVHRRVHRRTTCQRRRAALARTHSRRAQPHHLPADLRYLLGLDRHSQRLAVKAEKRAKAKFLADQAKLDALDLEDGA